MGGLTTERSPAPTSSPRPPRPAHRPRQAHPRRRPGAFRGARAPNGRRLASVLEVIYLIFNEGYVATARPSTGCARPVQKAPRLGRVLPG